MAPSSDFDFVDDASGGSFVPVGGSIVQLRQLVTRGEIDAAVHLFEENGGLGRAELLDEAKTASFETKKAIGQLFKRARDFEAAAHCYQQARVENEAAICFEQALHFAEAAGCWARAGELLKAAGCHERAGQVDAALAIYRQAGAGDAVAECLARGRRFTEAAAAFRELGNIHAEIQTLRAGLQVEPDNVTLALRLSTLLHQHAHHQQAVDLLVETAKRSPAARADVACLRLLAAALEATGNVASAAKVHARLRELPQGELAGAPGPAELPVVTGTAEPKGEPGGDAYGFLKAMPMFSELAIADMKALFRICALRTFAPGQHLIETGQPGKGLFVIVDGQVEVYGGPAEGSRLLNTLGVGSYVGEISLVQDGPTSARVTARSQVKALFVSRAAFLQYLYSTPSAALCIYRLFTVSLAERVRVLSAAR